MLEALVKMNALPTPAMAGEEAERKGISSYPHPEPVSQVAKIV
jgi:hypothetical protein